MVRGSIQLDSRGEYPSQRVRQQRPRGIQNRDVIESRSAGWRWRTAGTLPRVQRDVVVIAARREKRGLTPDPLRHLEAQHIPPKSERPLEVRHFQMHMADPD